MTFNIYGHPLRDGDCEVHVGQRHRYGTAACVDEDRANEPPTVEEECAARGHDLIAIEGGSRCYCGSRWFEAPRPEGGER